MITTAGKLWIKRYLAGQVPTIAASMGFGVGNVAENVADVRLQHEVERSNLTLTSLDLVNNKLIFKAPINPDFAGTIYEVCLYSNRVGENPNLWDSKTITTFDSADEDWLNSATGADSLFSATSVRIGADGLNFNQVLSTTVANSLYDIGLDLSGYSASDIFNIAYQTGSATASIVIRFKTDISNYYSITITSPTAGYRVDSITKGSAVATGTPSWANITILEVEVTTSAAGSAAVRMDGLRIEDVDTNGPDIVLVSREVLVTPFVKIDGRSQDMEYALDIVV